MVPENEHRELVKFKVVGLIPSVHFQKCRYIVERLHICYPEEYDKPEIRAMLNLDWDLYLTKMKRRHGKPYYLLRGPVAVYYNGELLGDDEDLMSYVSKSYSLETDMDFEETADQEIIDYFSNITEKYKRKFAYLTIAMNEHVVGSMLFMLYNDLVPITCDNFMNRCMVKSRTHGYKGTNIHRIAKYSWIQCGGFNLNHIHMPCENYSVPHDRRGVLSMCNKCRHEDNSHQFYITLEGASWMDYNYVAFGQLIQGAEILNLIEKSSTRYERPAHKIQIVNCGEFTLCPVPEEEYTKVLNPSFEALFGDEVKADDADSVLSVTGYKTEKYCLASDLRSYMPFTRYSKIFETYFKEISDQEKALESIEEQPEEVEQQPSITSIKVQDKLTNRSATPSRPFYYQKHVIM